MVPRGHPAHLRRPGRARADRTGGRARRHPGPRNLADRAGRALGDGRDVWFHGDVAPGNLLLAGGELAAVIDFGTCGVGDPACDTAIAWTLLTAEGRRAFRARLRVDEDTWARGRGWALWKTLVACTRTGEEAAEGRRVLGEIFAEYTTG
nr:phosphotransferase [Amycolatopsis tolypomycina]